MPSEPSDLLVNHVTERLRLAVNPDPRFPGDETAEWAEDEDFAEFRVLSDLLNVFDEDEIAERANWLVENATEFLGMTEP
jgi:hypothetical protein